MSPLTEAQRLRRTERFIAYIRAAVVAINSVTYLTLTEHGDRHTMALALIGIVWIYTFATLVAEPGLEERIRWFAIGNTLLDNIFIALWLWATGGPDSPYYVLYYAATVATVGRFGVFFGTIAAIGSGALYAGVVLVDGGGSLYTVSVRIAYIYILVAFVGHVVELARGSEREAAALEADAVVQRDAAALKDRFIATISHELRTPLTAVRGAAVTLSRHEGDFDESQRQELIGVIERQSQRLGSMIQDLLDFSLLQQGRIRLQIEEVELRSLVARYAADLQRRGSHRIVVEPGANSIWVECDAGKVGRAIAQIADNAAKFSPEGSTVRFRVLGSDDARFIEIEDEGRGVSSEESPRIFDRFYQADASLTRAAEGAGIGLTMARELVRLHGGDVTVVSAEGRGSTFRIELPVRSAAPAALKGLRSA